MKKNLLTPELIVRRYSNKNATSRFLLLLVLLLSSSFLFGQEKSFKTTTSTERIQLTRKTSSSPQRMNTVEEKKTPRNTTNEEADKNNLISKQYFEYRNQLLAGMNVVGKGLIPKADSNRSNVENMKVLHQWVLDNKDLFKEDYLKKSEEYFNQAIK